MALTSKKYSDIHDKTGDELTSIQNKFNDGFQELFSANPDLYPEMAAVIYQIQLMQEELDYLRTEISANKDKTGISSSQANAITANTAKTGITTQQASTITANDKAVNNNASEITKNTNAISNQAVEVNAAIKVGAYPPVLFAPAGFTQTHTSEVVYDTKLKKYFLNISYVETTPGKGGKSTRVVRTGQIELQ